MPLSNSAGISLQPAIRPTCACSADERATLPTAAQTARANSADKTTIGSMFAHLLSSNATSAIFGATQPLVAPQLERREDTCSSAACVIQLRIRTSGARSHGGHSTLKQRRSRRLLLCQCLAPHAEVANISLRIASRIGWLWIPPFLPIPPLACTT